MVDFLDIPEEVVSSQFLPVMRLHDILRFRRVCKLTKRLVDDFLRLKKSHGCDISSVIEINEKHKTPSSLLNLGFTLPVNHFYINNSSASFFDNLAIPVFLDEYGLQITHLRVRNCFTFTSESEYSFYEALPNLTSLEIEVIDGRMRECRHFTFPPTFRNLKRLKLGLVHGSPHDEMFGCFSYTLQLLQCCEKLEYVSYPQLRGITVGDMLLIKERGEFVGVTEMIGNRATNSPVKPNLKYYDLQQYEVGPENFFTTTIHFQALLEQCFQFGVKLLNVDSHLLSLAVSDLITDANITSFPLATLINIQEENLMMDSPDLEQIVIEGTSLCTFPTFLKFWPSWPALKTLDITVDSLYLKKRWGCMMKESTDMLLNFLFCYEDVRGRSNLVDLGLHFSETIPSGNMPCPSVGTIILCCPNLTKLQITNWPGSNIDLAILWSGLEKLEEITLGDIPSLGISAFVGINKENPILLKLKYLRKLTLKGLSKMPKITDTLFQLVIRHLKLREFYLESSEPIKNITVNGIRSLHTGEFSSSIEKFPFKAWSLSEVPDEDFQTLGSEFRSSLLV